MKMSKIGQIIKSNRKFTGHIVIINVENIQVPEMGKLGRETQVENIVREVKVTQIWYKREFNRNGSRELVNSYRKIEQKTEMTNFRRKSTGEIKTRYVERSHVTIPVTRDTSPCTMTCGDIP